MWLAYVLVDENPNNELINDDDCQIKYYVST